MADWDIWRKEANKFDFEYELSRFNSQKTTTYRKMIKELKTSLGLTQLLAPGYFSVRRRILLPKENARERAQFNGMTSAYEESIKLFKDADRYSWDPYKTLKNLAKKIKLRFIELKAAREQYDESNNKKIYDEMFITVEICYLIGTWRKFLNQENEFLIEFLNNK